MKINKIVAMALLREEGSLLSRNRSHIRLPRSRRLHPRNPPRGFRENQTPADLTLSLRQSSRDHRRTMGTGANGGEDEGMRVASMPDTA
jgi:hypothetical protein